MPVFEHAITFRVRYGETDQMGTFYNARALDWFECGRTELLRAFGLPYTAIEARGVFLPVVEAHLAYLGRARYDDLLELTAGMALIGRARLRCDVRIQQVEASKLVVRGYTIHAFADESGRVARPPIWFLKALATGTDQAHGPPGTQSQDRAARPGDSLEPETAASNSTLPERTGLRRHD